MQLRPYQIQGQQDIWNGWATNDILMFVLATGGGKTVTFVDITKQFLEMNKRAIIIAHREELISQAWQELYSNRIFSGILKGGVKPNIDLRCQVGSIQTLGRRDLSKVHAPDLIIIDEGHHVTNQNTYSKVLRQWPNAKVLIVTATPYRLNGDGFLHLVEGKETKLILNRTLFELQEDGYLVPFRFFVCSIPDMKNVSIKGGDYNDEESERAMEMAPLVQSYLEHAKGKSCIVFAVTTHHSRSIVEQYLAAGITAEHVDANTTSEERRAIFQRFRDKETMVMCNVGIATEGTDIPGIEAVQFARPSKSLALILQMLGRGSRTLKGVVDNPTLDTAEKRIAAILASAKPNCVVLDNAGVLIEHYQILQGEIDWEYYFLGKKRAKKPVTDEIEIIIFEAEDEDGNRKKTTNPKEIEGMRLVEITKENVQKVVNIKSLKEFDKYYAMGKSIKSIKKKAWYAIHQYIDYCKRNSFRINDACWDYVEQKLVTEVQERVEYVEKKTLADLGPNGLLQPEFSFKIAQLRVLGLSKAQFKFIKKEYILANP